jgi:hypothetical protein
LQRVAAHDCEDAFLDPWLTAAQDAPTHDVDDTAIHHHQRLIDHWSATGVDLVAIAVRLITPGRFNSIIDKGLNKADLLTEATCELAIRLTGQLDNGSGRPARITLVSDRHGGRAFYGSALQHVASGLVKVIREGKPTSQYELILENANTSSTTLDWSFTIGGDSMPAVAMSSMIAKWLRERVMHEFNRYFIQQMPPGKSLLPTAGYPQDADRFLRDIEQAGLRQSLVDGCLIRKR